MGYTWRYTAIFFLIWMAVLPVILKDVPFEHLSTHILIYGIGGFLLYLFIPFLCNIYLQKKDEKKYIQKLEVEENRRRFQREQYLRQKYRTLKFEELLANTEIDTDDKLLLLEFIYGYSLEDARKLLM